MEVQSVAKPQKQDEVDHEDDKCYGEKATLQGNIVTALSNVVLCRVNCAEEVKRTGSFYPDVDMDRSVQRQYQRYGEVRIHNRAFCDGEMIAESMQVIGYGIIRIFSLLEIDIHIVEIGGANPDNGIFRERHLTQQ